MRSASGRRTTTTSSARPRPCPAGASRPPRSGRSRTSARWSPGCWGRGPDCRVTSPCRGPRGPARRRPTSSPAAGSAASTTRSAPAASRRTRTSPPRSRKPPRRTSTSRPSTRTATGYRRARGPAGCGKSLSLAARAAHVFGLNRKERKRRKLGFWMGDARMKAATIHSFKGWESRAMVVHVGRAGTPAARSAVSVALSRLKRSPSGSFLTVVCSAPALASAPCGGRPFASVRHSAGAVTNPRNIPAPRGWLEAWVKRRTAVMPWPSWGAKVTSPCHIPAGPAYPARAALVRFPTMSG